MAEDKIVTGESFSKNHNDDEITTDEIPTCEPENVEDNLVTPAYEMTFTERKIREIIQSIEYEIMELEAKRSQIDAKTSAADIEFLINDRDILQKNLDEFLMALAEQQREETSKEDKEIMTCKKLKYDSAGTSASSEFTQKQWKIMCDLKSDSSSEEEMEMQRRNNENKLRRDESFVERMYERIEAAFDNSDFNDDDDDEPSQDPNLRIYTNIEGLADKLSMLSESDEELQEGKVEDDDADLKYTRNRTDID
ncbi:hypothetical protein K7X08_010280 [Anisodus acutangulus]|uniref:Uncharacterized protein n=1 Tax=Anisodus acutangulus TaxID=402998 RepID=A0A9Q1RUA5_9SOLA|nr:hypothetical protein K7X08_010280 [Anisodus acutangulus]